MPYHTRRRSVSSSFPPSPSSPSKSAPSPPALSRFPPPGLKLHPDDEGSRVFHAICRALASVDNCAMTVKDLAESALRHGLHCSGSAPVNAASQQITSFIRAHQRRCLDTSTPPLIKSFILSGTSDDDKFTPALHSRAGGTSKRGVSTVSTSFRKGTQVWYLSNMAGLQDPFQRVGLRAPPPCKKRRRVVRKDSSSEDSEEETRPKIKLKIRLAPLHSSCSTAAVSAPTAVPVPVPAPSFDDDDNDDEFSIPSPTSSTSSLALPPYPIESHCRYLRDIPLSPYDIPEYASPPPDSEDDEHDFHTSMLAGVDDGSLDVPMSPVPKSEADSDEFDEEEGRRSRSLSWATTADPKTPREGERPLLQYPVKIEGVDESFSSNVKVILDSWETGVSQEQSKEPEEGPAAEFQEHWMSPEDVDDLINPLLMGSSVTVKLEDDVEIPHSPFRVSRSFSAPLFDRPSSFGFSSLPSSPVTNPIDIDNDDVEILEPDSVAVEEFDREHIWETRRPEFVKRSSTARLPLRAVATECNIAGPSPIKSTFVEGVRIYEMTIDGTVLRRRVDNSLVHLSSLLTFLSQRIPSSKFMHLDGALHVRHGDLRGTWVPLNFARSLVKNRLVPKEMTHFLQDIVPVRRFHTIPQMKVLPPSNVSLEENRRADSQASEPVTLLPPISISSSSRSPDSSAQRSKMPSKRSSHDFPERPVWQRDGFTDWKVNTETELTALSTPFAMLVPMKAVSTLSTTEKSVEGPLSPQEEEIFRTLVDMQDPKTAAPRLPPTADVDEADEAGDESEIVKSRPRRSKRVAASRVPARSNPVTECSATLRRSNRLRKQ